MKKLKIISLLFICLIINISCSENETNTELSDIQILTKKEWIYKNFEFLESNNKGKFTSKDFENKVNTMYNGLTMKFNDDGSGYFKSISSSLNKNFTWVLTNDKLQMTLPNPTEVTDDVINYLVNLKTNELSLTMTFKAVVFIDGKELSVRGVQYFK